MLLQDEHGQSVIHFAAIRSYPKDGLFHLLQESQVNVGFRDELYRTARDVAELANIRENMDEIDRYVAYLTARGNTYFQLRTKFRIGIVSRNTFIKLVVTFVQVKLKN